MPQSRAAARGSPRPAALGIARTIACWLLVAASTATATQPAQHHQHRQQVEEAADLGLGYVQGPTTKEVVQDGALLNGKTPYVRYDPSAAGSLAEGRALTEVSAAVGTEYPGAQQLSVRRGLQQSGTPTDGWECSTTNASTEAVLSCVNAIRVDPDVLSDAPCFSRIRSSLVDPPRKALDWDNLLTSASQQHAASMVEASKLLPARAYNDILSPLFYTSEQLWRTRTVNAAVGHNNAKELVTNWLCSEEHRGNLFSTTVNVFGAAVSTSPDGTTFHSLMFRTLWYAFRMSSTGVTCMAAEDKYTGADARVVQRPCSKADPWQRFRLEYRPATSVAPYNWRVIDASGRCAKILDGDLSDFAALTLKPCDDGPAEMFDLQSVQTLYGDGYWYFPYYALRVKRTERCIWPADGKLQGIGFYQYGCPGAFDRKVFFEVIPF